MNLPDLNLILGEQLAALTIGVVVVTVLRFAVGTFAALRDNTFVTSSVGAFIRAYVWGRVAPILSTAYLAAIVEGPTGIALTAFALAQGAAYLTETYGAVQEAFSQTAVEVASAKAVVAEELGNPVPTE